MYVFAFAATVALALGLYFLLTLTHDRGTSSPRGVRVDGADAGPVPGYRFYPAAAVDPSLWADVDGWRPHSLEVFVGGGRRRLVVTARRPPWAGPAEARRVAALLTEVSARLLARCDADVIVLELANEPTGPSFTTDWVALRSRDGLGWSGSQRSPTFFIEGPRLISESVADNDEPGDPNGTES